jgi:hypothetical protein
MYYHEGNELQNINHLRVGDTFPERIFSRCGYPEIDNRIWTVVYVLEWEPMYRAQWLGEPDNIIIVQNGMAYLPVAEGDWVGCSRVGNSIEDCLAKELMSTIQWHALNSAE